MALNLKDNHIPCDLEESSGKQFKREDLLTYSNIFASEFDNSALHDRILVLKVMEEGLGENYQCEVKGIEDNKIAPEQENEEVCTQEEDTQGGSTINGSIEKQEKEPLLSELDNQNSERPTTVTKTEKENIQTAEEVEKSEYISTINENPLQEQRLFIHSLWLAVQSSYFRALFYSSGMKESSSKEITLKVAEEEFEAHYTLIKAMYQPSILDDIDPYIVLQVLILANKYDVNLIFKKCKYVLMSVVMSLQLCESVLITVNEMVATGDLIEYLQKFLVDTFRPLDKFWLTDEFMNLSEVSLKMLLSCNELSVLSENTVFVALMSWCEYNEYNGPSLLSLLRPELMTNEFLHDVVYNHHLAKQMDEFNKLLLDGFRYHSSSPKRRELPENEIIRRAEYKGRDKEPSFTWQFCISEDNHQNYPELYKSEHFWWCGLEIMLALTFETNSWNIRLYVLNIKDMSCLNFVWEIEAELFPGQPVRRAVPFREYPDLGFHRIQFEMSRPNQSIPRNFTHPINIFIHFV